MVDKIRTLKTPNKELHLFAMEEVMEVLYQQHTHHPNIREVASHKSYTKKYYQEFFGGDFLPFFQTALKADSSLLDCHLLDFAVEVFKQDYVGQHKSSKMVEYLCREQANFVIKNLRDAEQKNHRKFTLHRLVNLISMFMADIGNVQLFVNLIFILYARWRFEIVCLQTNLASLAIRKNLISIDF